MCFTASDEIKTYLGSDEFRETLITMRAQFPVAAQVAIDGQLYDQAPQHLPDNICVHFSYTRNNQGSVKDAIEFLVTRLVSKGMDASSVKGMIPRPKSDSFEDSLPFFESKVLHRTADASGSTDSPTRSLFGDGSETTLVNSVIGGPVATPSSSSTQVSVNGPPQAGFFAKIRKGPSSFSFMDRKNRSNSPGSLFRHASSNASKASLISIESQNSGYRNPWNDSGINLVEEEAPQHHGVFPGNGLMGPPKALNHSYQGFHSNGNSQHNGNNPVGYLDGLHSSNGPVNPAVQYTRSAINQSNNSSHTNLTLSNTNNGNGSNGHKFPHYTHLPATGDTTPTSATTRYDPRASFDSGRPSTSHSFQGYPGAIGPPR